MAFYSVALDFPASIRSRLNHIGPVFEFWSGLSTPPRGDPWRAGHGLLTAWNAAVLNAPSRHDVHILAAALRTPQALGERWHFQVVRLVIDVDLRAVSAIQAMHGQCSHAVRAHVGEVHRRAAIP